MLRTLTVSSCHLIVLLWVAAQPTSAAAEPSTRWSIDGAIRLRGESWSAEALGPIGPARPEEEDILLARVLGGVTAQTSSLTARVQFSYHEQAGRASGDRPTDAGSLDLHQAYIQWKPTDTVSVKLGRQEMPLGSGRLFSLRNGPNIRLAFDAAQASFDHPKIRSMTFYGRPVENRADAFDDRPNLGLQVWGIYNTLKSIANTDQNLDLYYIGYDREQARFGTRSGREMRHSLGLRYFGAAAEFDWNVEAVVQGGRYAGGDIGAWTIASDVGRQFSNLPLEPRLGLKANVTSGDDDNSDLRLGTFNPLFPNLSYFSEAALLSPQNHIDVQPSLRLNLTDRLLMTAAADVFWRTRSTDAVYRAPSFGVPVGSPDRRTGTQYDVEFRWRARKEVDIAFGFVRWEPASPLRDIGAEPSNFVLISTDLRFSRALNARK